MSVPAPHFLLHARANRAGRSGRWAFSLESNDGSHSLEIEDAEPDTRGERLELLALVRGLEALPQPAQVTVVAPSPRLNRMLNGGLEEWRANGWRWENHGEMVPVKDADLWRRVDRALHFHEVRLKPRNAAVETAASNLAAPSASADTALRRNGAHRAMVMSNAASEPSPEPDRCRKSLARKVLQSTAVLRRRLRQCRRRWTHLIETMAADDDTYAWAD
jgi:ribonuclease HI